MTAPRKLTQDEQIRLLDIGAGRDTSLTGRLARAETELQDLSAQTKEAYRRWKELDQQLTVKAAEVRELRFQIREEAERNS